MCGGPLDYITYELVPASPAVSCMSGSSNLNSFRDRRQVSLRFFDMRREKHNFFLYWIFHLTPNNVWHPHRKLLVWPRRPPKIDFLVRSLNLNLLVFFSKSQNPQPRFRAWRHSRPWYNFLSGEFIVTFLIVTSASRAHEHLHSMCAPN